MFPRLVRVSKAVKDVILDEGNGYLAEGVVVDWGFCDVCL